MKKIILPILMGLLTIGTISATENPAVNTKIEKVKTEDATKKFFKQIKNGDYKAVKKMLASGQKVNEKSNGLTPLMFAARYNKHKIAKLLIGSGADVNALSSNGKFTPLKMARISKAKETYYVIKNAIDKNSKTINS